MQYRTEVSKMYTGAIITFTDSNPNLVVGRNGQVPPPSEYKVQTSDIDNNSSRNQAGYMTRNRVRGGNTTAYTVTATWKRLSWSQLQALIAAGEAPSFHLTILDPKSVQGTHSGEFYRNANMEYTLSKIYEDDEAFWSCTMSFVEL